MKCNNKIKIAWVGKHFGEEPPLIGGDGQGAGGVFFSGCNLRCVFCQNYQISQEKMGEDYTIENLASTMLYLEKQGVVNIDLVSPTIWWQQIRQAIIVAKEAGLNIPVVWNSNGFESVEILRLMEGLVDIYLPDFKYGDDELAYKYSGIKKYVEVATAAINEMKRQVGNLKIENGLAKRGLIIRHMVLPNNGENSRIVLKILSGIDKDVHFSLMNQYYPLHRADNFVEINRGLEKEEFDEVYNYLLDLGFQNGWVQASDSSEVFIPDFRQENPFIHNPV